MGLNTSRSRLPKLLLWTGLMFAVLVVSGLPAYAQQQSGSVNVTSRVDGAPPTQPAVITSPTDGEIFSSSIVSVAGTCPSSTIVELYRNNLLAGSAVCDLTANTFSIQITLVAGSNSVYARVKDTLDQYGPDSSVVQIFYIPPTASPTPSSTKFNTAPSPSGTITPISDQVDLLLTGDGVHTGLFANQELKILYEIKGGQPAYAVKINWGDGVEDKFENFKVGQYFATHTYSEAGTYNITLSITDSAGRNAIFQTVAIINGAKSAKQCDHLDLALKNASSSQEDPCSVISPIQINIDRIWPAFTIVSLVIMTLALLRKFIILWLFS